MDKKPTGSIKQIGPIHLVYSGKQHIGNVIAPSIGGSREGAQHYTAISKFWGIKKNHESKMAALQWLKQQHGEPMKMESVNESLDYKDYKDHGEHLTPEENEAIKPHVHPAVRLNGKLYVGKRGDEHIDLFYKHSKYHDADFKTYKRGFYHPGTKTFYHTSLVNFDTPDLMTKTQRMRKYNTESINESVRTSTHVYKHPSGYTGYIFHEREDGKDRYQSTPDVQHKLVGPFKTVLHSSMEKAHKRMKGLGYKHSGETSVKTEEDMKNIGSNYPLQIISEDPNWLSGNAAEPEQDTVGLTALGLSYKKKKLKIKKLVKQNADNAAAELDQIAAGQIKSEAYFIVVDKAKEKLLKAKASNDNFRGMNNDIHDKNDAIKEELFDKDVNRKDPKAGPQPKKDDKTGDEILQIKRTVTGKPGDIISINPKMQIRKGAPDSGPDSEHKSKVGTTT